MVVTTVYKGACIRKKGNGSEVQFVAGEYNDLPQDWIDKLKAAGALEPPTVMAPVIPPTSSAPPAATVEAPAKKARAAKGAAAPGEES